MMLPSLLVSLILFVLGIIHFYWAIGGAYGFEQSLPTKENGERVINPKKIDSAIVGIGLTVFALFYVFQTGLIKYDLPVLISKYGGWLIPIIFLLRAVGEFKYIGFFKKIRRTEFGKLDTWFFSPLCLGIGIVGVIIELMK